MAMFGSKKSANPLAQLETELTATRRKRSDLVTRRDKLAYALGEAEAARRDALLIDDSDESDAALTKAMASVESYRSSLQGVDLVLAEHDVRIADLEAEIATGKSRAERERQAGELETKAKAAQAAFDRYLAAADELSQALDGTKLFEADEAVAWTRRLANDLRVAQPRILQSIDGQVRRLRAEPEKPALQPEPPPVGAISPYRRKFEHDVAPGAIGDRRPMIYDAFAEKG